MKSFYDSNSGTLDASQGRNLSQDSAEGQAENHRLFYTQHEWSMMRSPRSKSRDTTGDVNVVKESDDFLLTFPKQQKKTNPKVLSDLHISTCLPTLQSPMEWLKQSLRARSPAFLWQQNQVSGRRLFSDDETHDDGAEEQCFDLQSPMTPVISRQELQEQLEVKKHDESARNVVSTFSSMSSSSGELVASPPPPPPPTGHDTSQNTRIVAPYVDLLSLGSVVEVLLLSDSESIAVLCSVDVLKMYSHHYQRLLQSQEKEASELKLPTPLDEVWRNTIVVKDQSPFEAVSLLEYLHDNQSPLAMSDWNLSWARLSVEWEVECLCLVYSKKIAQHLSKVLHSVEELHWRLNPTVLLGKNVAVLTTSLSEGRVTPSHLCDDSIPKICMGKVIEAPSFTPKSSILVNFDVNTTPSSLSIPGSEVTDTTSIDDEEQENCPTFISLKPCSNSKLNMRRDLDLFESLSPAPIKPKSHSQRNNTDDKCFKSPRLTNQEQQQQPTLTDVHGDLSPTSVQNDKESLNVPAPGNAKYCIEPFWVLDCKADSCGKGNCWLVPDNLCEKLLDEVVSSLDKHIFWEMIYALCNFPALEDGKCLSNNSKMKNVSNNKSDHKSNRSVCDIINEYNNFNTAERKRYAELISVSPSKRKIEENCFTEDAHKDILKKFLDPLQLASFLCRVECRFLWTEESVEFLLPKALKAIVHEAFSLFDSSAPFDRNSNHAHNAIFHHLDKERFTDYPCAKPHHNVRRRTFGRKA